jgi:hypothetical protein
LVAILMVNQLSILLRASSCRRSLVLLCGVLVAICGVASAQAGAAPSSMDALGDSITNACSYLS